MPRPKFSVATPLEYTEEDKDELLRYICDVYEEAVENRKEWEQTHREYEDLFRGIVPPREGPWENSANVHIPVTYWLVDAFNVRLVSTIWSQQPLVGGEATEDDDEAIMRDARELVTWHLSPKRMNGREIWNRASKIRLIHGYSISLVSYEVDKYSFNVDQYDLEVNDGQPKSVLKPKRVEKTKYAGPVVTPLSFEETVLSSPFCMNVQPNTSSNNRGAEWVAVRQQMTASLIMKKYKEFLEDKWTDKEEWLKAAPEQSRSMSLIGKAERDHQDAIGIRHGDGKGKNPNYEVIYWFGPWKDPQGEEDEECEQVVEICLQPKVFLRAYRLGDLYYKNRRPLLEMHFQTVSTYFHSMGIPEIVGDLNAEIDALHNMRIDIGQATNLPFIFYRPSSGFDPDEVELVPLTAIPVDDPSGVVIPQFGSVTTFYVQEEQQFYALIERVVGITDLFLGVSPTHGAAARHATGFVGTQQEALARTSQVIAQDSRAFSQLCHWVYELDMQYGPTWRSIRLLGRSGPLSDRVALDDLWLAGDYDFSLGANEGTYSSMLQQQQSQAVMQTIPNNPFMQQEPGRLWEAYARYYYSIGLTTSEIELLIGPKEAVSQGTPKSQEEENLQMAQYVPGNGIPAPVHPSDDDRKHLEELNAWMVSPEYEQLGRPNEVAYYQHGLLHNKQMQQKQTKMWQMQQQEQRPPGSGGLQPEQVAGQQDRMVAGMLSQPGGRDSSIAQANQPPEPVATPRINTPKPMRSS